MLAGIEFVKDKTAKTPFPRALKFAETFAEIAQAEGLVVWQSSGGADGVNGDFVMIAPPFIITEAEIDDILARFVRTLDKMTTEAR